MRIGIHPFPARMAPELALASLSKLPAGSSVLDPMTGSGTVARQAVNLGHRAWGFDLDPLAVLISKVSTTPVDDDEITQAATKVLELARELDPAWLILPWLDGDEAGERFVEYWFGPQQRADLRRLAYLLHHSEKFGFSNDVTDVLRLSLSRIIVTKKQCASLAQDTSHSRPHRVSLTSDYDVLAGFEQSVKAVRRRLQLLSTQGEARIERGDARSLKSIPDGSIDTVLTSPPYLNAIDYMRGHRLSLIWLGHAYSELTGARSASIGSERRPDAPLDEERFSSARRAMGQIEALPARYRGMIDRYILDLHHMVGEVARVLKSGAEATFVMGNSCLKGVYIHNSEGLAEAARAVGLRCLSKEERELPAQHRYLPTPTGGALGKRMRHEIVLTFAKG